MARTTTVDLSDVPHGAFEPGSMLWPLGAPIQRITLFHTQLAVDLPPEIRTEAQRLTALEAPGTFFNGPYASVAKVDLNTRFGEIGIEFGDTTMFDYQAAALAYREDEGLNPVRPLAVQAVPITPMGTMVAIRKPMTVTDFPGAVTVIGKALQPGIIDPYAEMVDCLNRKLGRPLSADPSKPVTIDQGQLLMTGLVRDNLNNIYCICYLVMLTEEQWREMRGQLGTKPDGTEYLEIPLDQFDGLVLGTEAFAPGKWDPNGLYNVLYALAGLKIRTIDQLDGLADEIINNIDKTGGSPFIYAMERFQERLAELDSRKGDQTITDEVACGQATGYTEGQLLWQINPGRYPDPDPEAETNPHGH